MTLHNFELIGTTPMTSDSTKQNTSKPTVQTVPLSEAVGLVLAHDITEIVPGEKKGPAFCKGHVVREQDIEHLSRIGKQHLYVLNIGPDQMHENDAAELLAGALGGPGVRLAGPPKEGKIELLADCDGLFFVDVDRLMEFNLVPDVMCATIHRYSPVKKGQCLAGTRAIPLVISRAHVDKACTIAAETGNLLVVKPYRRLKVAMLVTGSEVANGLIEDKFGPIVSEKISTYGSTMIGVNIVTDDRSAIADNIKEFLNQGAEMIIVTGGMSVDPDDITRHAIKDAGGRDLVYGAPVLPGAMLLTGVLDGPNGAVPILGVPACAMYYRTTVLDLVLARILAGEQLSRRDIAALAHGGFCQSCEDGCHFPVCGFGRGA
jgi:molybdenum cofactor synthesis domain-containing protein